MEKDTAKYNLEGNIDSPIVENPNLKER